MEEDAAEEASAAEEPEPSAIADGGGEGESEIGEPAGSSQDSMGTTLDLPGLSDPEPENDLDVDDEDQRDSQVGGWWGKAYQVLNKLQKLHTKQVPLPVLYEMHMNGEVMEEYHGTFEADDLQPPICISSVNVLFNLNSLLVR